MTQGQTPYLYVLVRTDLSLAQQAVQAAHAVIEASPSIPSELQHPHLILCGVKSESQLSESLQRLREAGIQCYEWREDDLDNQLTSIATEPVYGEDREHFNKFQLLTMKPENRSSHFRAYTRCQKELDNLLIGGDDDSEEAELLRDQMDFHWYKLSEEELNVIRKGNYEYSYV